MKWQRQVGNGIPDARKQHRMTGFWPAVLLFSILLVSLATQARDASFLDPGATAGAGAGEDAVRVEPKGDIDIGDSVLNVARRTDLFFVNQSPIAVKVEKVAVNGDGNVVTEVVGDDCSKQGTIPPGSRCSVEISLTPSSSGSWAAEVLLTHDGVGRLARAKLTGKTTGATSVEKKDMGLALNTKEAPPVNFGDVEVDNGKVVRSALMVNDSNEPITLYAIDVIEASNGLQKLDQGCAVDMELKPGESCPVTLVWTPSSAGQVSTDLIIRHSGRLGFAVIPIRGNAKGEGKGASSTSGSSSVSDADSKDSKHGIPSPPGATEVASAASGKIPAVAADDLGAGESKPVGTFYLIGTVGNRAVILKPDGKTVVANSGEDFDLGEKQVKVVLVGARSVDLLVDGKKKTIYLGSSPELIEKAALHAKAKTSKDSKEFGLDSSPSMTTSPSGALPSSTAVGGSVSGAPK